MQTLYLYSTFSKMQNSTKVPASNATHLTVTGILKEPCSILNPVIRIERLSNDINPRSYTYCRWTDTLKYYFVEDWVWTNGLWEVHLKEDVLATHRSAIGSASAYILRTNSTTNFNGNITDTLYPATTDVEIEYSNLVSPFASYLDTGCYIVGIISGGSQNAVGAITYYSLTSDQFKALKNKLFSNDNLEIMGIIDSGGASLVTDLSQEVLKTMYNPYQYIASCMWFPIPANGIPNVTSVSTINIGWWSYGLSGYLINEQTMRLLANQYTFNGHPQAATRGNYLNHSPYTKMTVLGPFGNVAIDTLPFSPGEILEIDYVIDLITGMCQADIYHRDTTASTATLKLLQQRNFLLGVPIQIAQVGTDYLGTAVSAINTIPQITGGAVNGFLSGKGAVMGAISGAANGIYNTLQAVMPQVETGGQNGSFLASRNNVRISEIYYKIADEDISHKGRPLCQTKRINTLSGFILCADGDIAISACDNERAEIRNFLTTGFYWE